MRAFSELEKQLIHRMIELDEKAGSLNVLGNIIDSFYGKSHLPDHCYIKLKAENDVSIQIRNDAISQNGVDWIRSIDEDISKKLLSVVALFEYLETQKLAYFVGNLNMDSLGVVWADTAYTRCEFLDDDLKPVIYKYSRKKIFISETLRVFVKNDFKTDEEIRHEKEVASIAKQLKITRIALAFTIVGLLISILVPILVTSAIDIKNDRIVTELNPKTIAATQDAIKAGLTPVIQELASTQEKLNIISNSIREATEASLLNEQKSSEALGIKLDGLAKTLIESSNKIEKTLAESHNKKIQSTAKSGG